MDHKADSAPAQRRLYVSMILSLDGYIEGPGHELDWFADDNPQFVRYADEMLDSVGVAIYGRKAYDVMIQHWPDAEANARSAEDLAFAQRMNALPKVVLSRTLPHATWNNTRVVRDVEAIAALKREPGKPIVAWAGAELVATLLAHHLVDEIRLVIVPVVLGGGTPMFRTGMRLRQVRTQSLGGDHAVLCYEPIQR
ncbi:MAG: dihydrofolate reductase family protein [Myxococcales bacterium]|nr:dihydrofolate reductase family protein [Myxococcales bacterium]